MKGILKSEKYRHQEGLTNLANHYFVDDQQAMLWNQVWVRDPFRGQDKSMDQQEKVTDPFQQSIKKLASYNYLKNLYFLINFDWNNLSQQIEYRST